MVLYRGDDPQSHAEGLSVGLLLRAPTPEGDCVELSAPGYQRQAVAFGAFSPFTRAARSVSGVKFVEVYDWPDDLYVGIFRADGSLLAGSRFSPWPSTAEMGEILFAAGALRLRFS